MKQLQFEIWTQCDSKCSFCYLGKRNKLVSVDKKIKNLNIIYNKISDLNLYSTYDTLAFIGGEFFQGQLDDVKVKDNFFKLAKKVNELLENNYIKNVWYCATLTSLNQNDLYLLLDIFKKNIDKVWLLTSYDTLGRFHTDKMLKNWQFNMLNIKKLYPNINLNTTIILTGDFIEKYLNNEINLKLFSKTYQTSLFFKVCSLPKGKYKTKIEMNKRIGNFFPNRSTFIKFLIKFKQTEESFLWDKLFNIEYRADTLFCEHNNCFTEINRDKKTYMELYDTDYDYVLNCGHLSTYSPYLDSDACVICDKKEVENIIC